MDIANTRTHITKLRLSSAKIKQILYYLHFYAKNVLIIHEKSIALHKTITNINNI